MAIHRHAGPIFVNRSDEVFAQAVWVSGVVPVGLQVVPVMPEQTVDRAEPQEPVPILRDAPRECLKATLFVETLVKRMSCLSMSGSFTMPPSRDVEAALTLLCARAGCRDAEEHQDAQDGEQHSPCG